MNSTNSVTGLTRNGLNRRASDHYSSENSNENLNKMWTEESNEPPPPPNLISSTNGATHAPTPLLLASLSSSSSSSACDQQTSLTPNINSNISCVKKRVWTPVQTNSSLNKTDPNGLISANPSLSEVSFFS